MKDGCVLDTHVLLFFEVPLLFVTDTRQIFNLSRGGGGGGGEIIKSPEDGQGQTLDLPAKSLVGLSTPTL